MARGTEAAAAEDGFGTWWRGARRELCFEYVRDTIEMLVKVFDISLTVLT